MPNIDDEPFQQKYISGWGPLIINGKQVYYEGYPDKPAPSTIQKMKEYEDFCNNRGNESKITNDTKIEYTAHEDCNGNTYYERGYYENLPNGGFKWIDCGSGYNVSKLH